MMLLQLVTMAAVTGRTVVLPPVYYRDTWRAGWEALDVQV